MTAQADIASTTETSGARTNMPLLALAGNDRLLEDEFEEVGEGLERAPGPTTFGPRRNCTAPQILRSR